MRWVDALGEVTVMRMGDKKNHFELQYIASVVYKIVIRKNVRFGIIFFRFGIIDAASTIVIREHF